MEGFIFSLKLQTDNHETFKFPVDLKTSNFSEHLRITDFVYILFSLILLSRKFQGI